MIHELIEAYYSKPQPFHKGSGRIPVSSFGRCLRATMLNLTSTEPSEFPSHVREVMDLGVAFETTTRNALNAQLGAAVKSDVPIGDSIWSGRMDFLVQQDGQLPVIIEHKAVNSKFFDYSMELPRFEHVCQAYLYGQLYNDLYHIKPKVVLYYRSWSDFAELTLCEGDPAGYAEGQVNGQKVRRPVALETLPKRRADFETAYKNLPSVPDVPCSTSCDAFGCTFRGSRSCRFFSSCFPSSGDLTK